LQAGSGRPVWFYTIDSIYPLESIVKLFSKANILALFIISVMISGCSSAEEPQSEVVNSSAETEAEVQPTDTPDPLPTATEIPTPTPLPGSQVLPLDSMAEELPWLPLDESAVPGTYYYFFDVLKPPFDNTLVRQAFASAIDRDVLVEITVKLYSNWYINPRSATNMTPPEILGRDVYNEIGLRFDPEAAKDYFIQAGYEDPSGFPEITLLVNVSGATAPGYHIKMAETAAAMWKEHLGVTVNVVYTHSWEEYLDRLENNPTEIVKVFWGADYNDPDNFLRELFATDAGSNSGNYSNPDFDDLVYQAAELTDPAERQLLYLAAEKLLCETDAAVIPIYHATYSQ
jgi:ABC-type transport system substrate-binding protein